MVMNKFKSNSQRGSSLPDPYDNYKGNSISLDLNPEFARQRHQRAVKVANRYMGVVGQKLKEMHF